MTHSSDAAAPENAGRGREVDNATPGASAQSDRDPVQVARELGLRFGEQAARRDAGRIYPDEEMAALKSSGLNALFVPREYGGLDANYRTATRVLAELAEGDPNLAQIPQAHHCGVEFLKFVDNHELMDRYFPRIVEHGALFTNAFSEKSTSRAVDDFAVTMRPDGDGYRLSGTKFYVTGSRWADGFFVPARLQDAAHAPDPALRETDIVLAWCDAHDAGVELSDDWDSMGQRTTASGSLLFNDVRIESDSVVGADWGTDVPFNYQGTHAQIMFCAILLGVARAALSDTIGYLRREARPWIHSGTSTAATDPYVLHRVGQLDIDVTAAAAVLDVAADALDTARASRAARDRDEGSVAVASAKALTTQIALRTTAELFQICGTRSTRARWGFDRHWRNVRTLTLHDPVDYKYRLVGDYRINRTSPPISAWT